MTATAKETAELWNMRYGHMGYDSMAKLPSIVTRISVTAEQFKKVANDNICETCVTSKQSRLPFACSQSKTSQPLELVHIDSNCCTACCTRYSTSWGKFASD